MMGNVNTQIQRAISVAISNQMLPQIQTALNAGSGHLTQNRWNVPSERPEMKPEEAYGEKAKKNNRCEQRLDYQNGNQPNLRAYDNYENRIFSFRFRRCNSRVGCHEAEFSLSQKKQKYSSRRKMKVFTNPKNTWHICCMARLLRSLRQVATLRHGHMARRSASLRSCI